MHPERRIRLSKFLSLILRHRPEQVGLVLDAQGRVPLTTLVEALRAHGWDDLRGGEIEEVIRLDARRYLAPQVPTEWLHLPAPAPMVGPG